MSASRDDFGIALRSALLQRGARQKFSLFFLICLSIFIFFLDSFSSKFMNSTRSLINDGIYRVSVVTTSPMKFSSYVKNSIIKHFSVYEENKVFKKELEILRSKNFKNEFLISENKKLQEILESKIVKDNSYVIGKVILDKNSPFLKSLVINKGSRAGVKKGMPVIEGNHLVGRIVEVNYLSSRVLLLTDLNSRIPVIIANTGTQAILSGAGNKLPSLEYLPEFYQRESGNTIYTSGKDGILSAGIPAGETLIIDGELGVKLFSDPNQLSFVNVVLTNKNSEETDF